MLEHWITYWDNGRHWLKLNDTMNDRFTEILPDRITDFVTETLWGIQNETKWNPVWPVYRRDITNNNAKVPLTKRTTNNVLNRFPEETFLEFYFTNKRSGRAMTETVSRQPLTRGTVVSIPDHSMWDLRRRRWHTDKFLSNHFNIHLSISLYQCSIFMSTHKLFLPVNNDEEYEHSKELCSFANRAVVHWDLLSVFYKTMNCTDETTSDRHLGATHRRKFSCWNSPPPTPQSLHRITNFFSSKTKEQFTCTDQVVIFNTDTYSCT